jgi:hypothetical protein
MACGQSTAFPDLEAARNFRLRQPPVADRYIKYDNIAETRHSQTPRFAIHISEFANRILDEDLKNTPILGYFREYTLVLYRGLW